jgi:hypothetical protein
MEQEIIDVTPKKKCNKCDAAKNLKTTHKLTIALSVYILISSIYGTVCLIKEIISLF